MWIAWIAWVVNGTILDFFFNVFIVSMVLFIVVFKISCVCNVPSFIRSNLLQEVVLTKKTCVQQTSLGCANAFVKIFNISMCVHVLWNVFFLEFPACQNFAIYAQLMWKEFQEKHWHDAWKKQKCEFDVGILSASNVFNPYIYIYVYIYGSKSFAFVVGALLLLHLWFLNHVAIQCERKGPKRFGW